MRLPELLYLVRLDVQVLTRFFITFPYTTRMPDGDSGVLPEK